VIVIPPLQIPRTPAITGVSIRIGGIAVLTGRGAAWLARLLGVQEVVGSNPAVPIFRKRLPESRVAANLTGVANGRKRAVFTTLLPLFAPAARRETVDNTMSHGETLPCRDRKSNLRTRSTSPLAEPAFGSTARTFTSVNTARRRAAISTKN